MKGINKSVHDVAPEILPVIPTMDVVVFPQMLVPLLVLDEKIIEGINQTLQESKFVLFLQQKSKLTIKAQSDQRFI